MEEKEKKKEITELEAQLRLAEILNDSPRTIVLGGREFQLRALKPGAQWLIAQESCKIAKHEGDFTDLIKQFAVNAPAVVRCLCIAILNDKEKIEGKEYQDLFDFIQWETKQNEWIGVLLEVLKMLDISFFLTSTQAIENFRKMTMMKKTKGQS